VVEASMGYFLTPLLNVVAGVLVFRERLARANIAAILFAAAGVVWYMAATAIIPWVGLALGISFAGYGLLRKRMVTNAVPGLFIEVLLLLPFTLTAIVWLHIQDQAQFLGYSRTIDILLVLAGLVSVLPLAFFTAGTRMLPMTTVGILFYLTPSLQFLCGILLLGESFDIDKLIGFTAIWTGLAIFTWNLLANRSRREYAPP
ncbi:MAG: EamA family transporter, partial [Gammaproteobacteria bacterium]